MQRKFLVFVAMLITVTWQACEYEVLPAEVNCEENPVTLTLVSVENSNCELSNGQVEVLAMGGSGNYKYKLGSGEPQISPVFGSLGAALYEVTALDDNNCSSTIEVAVLNSNGMNIAFMTTDAGGCGAAGGTLTVEAFEGTAPYSYRLNGGSFSSDPVFDELSSGEYNLIVSDAGGCEVTQVVKIRSGISYATSIAPIIKNSCAINGCHNGSRFPDFRVFKNIHDNASKIKKVTADGSMPPEGSLTQAEINMIACWVDDGAPEN